MVLNLYNLYKTIDIDSYIGTVVYLTSPQEPGQIVSQLKHKTKKEGLMFGQYIQTDNVVRCAICPVNWPYVI